jgi:plasmid stabilization system protein ParE
MADRTVRWTHLARADLRDALAWRGGSGRGPAIELSRGVRHAVDSITALPEIGVAARDLSPPGRYRHIVVGEFRLIYRLDRADDVIIVLRFWDCRRDPEALKVEP